MVGFNKSPKFKQGKKSMTPKKFQADDDDEVQMDVDKTSSMKKKGFNSSFQTPGMKNNNKGMRVSFQLPGSPLKSASKAKHPPTPMPKKKSMTPVSSGKSNMEFKGMSAGKQQMGSGKKAGKGLGSVMQKLLDKSDEEDDDDDDEDDDDDDDDDDDQGGEDDDQDGGDMDDDDDDDDDDDEDSDDSDSEDEAEIKRKLMAIKQKQMAGNKSPKVPAKQNESLSAKQTKNAKKAPEGNTAEKKNAAKLTAEDSEDDDDDDDEEDDDDDDDDDDEDESEEESDDEIKKKLLAIKQKKMMGDTSPQKSNLKNKAAATPVKTPAQGNVAKNQTSPAEAAKKTPQAKKQDSPVKTQNVSKELLNSDLERKRERDARHLFVRGLPSDATVDEVKTLSPDIIAVNIPQRNKWKKKISRVFAFLEFASEKKAEENFNFLKNKKFRGEAIFVDYSGEKSARYQNKDEQKVFNKLKLFVSGLPCDVTMVQVAQLFPKAISITLNAAPEYRNASVVFRKEEDTEEALKQNEKPKIAGKAITVLYSLAKSATRKQKRKAAKSASPNKAGPPAKKMKTSAVAKQEVKQEEESEDDDDDDDDDDSDE